MSLSLILICILKVGLVYYSVIKLDFMYNYLDLLHFCSSSDGSMLSVNALTGKIKCCSLYIQ